MTDYIEIGPVPANEECQQVGTPSYNGSLAYKECQRFTEAIRSVLGNEPYGASLKIKSNPHDFGSYYEVVCCFDDSNEVATEYAYKCEAEAPQNWPAPQEPGGLSHVHSLRL